MALVLPIDAAEANYRIGTTIADVAYLFDVRWNDRDGAWYFDVLTDDEKVIACGIKIVLGALLGRRINHPLFRRGIIVATDVSGSGKDATRDDLGTRIQVLYFTAAEVLSLRVT